MARPEPPARALPNRVVADFGFDLAVAHSGIVIPGGIVGAHMLEAEPIIAVQVEPGSGRAEISPGNAAGVIAEPWRGIGLTIERGI